MYRNKEEMSRAQLRRLTRTNSLSSPSMTATEGALVRVDPEPSGAFIQPNRLRRVVEAPP